MGFPGVFTVGWSPMQGQPTFLPALHQKTGALRPNRNIYWLGGLGIALTLTFLTPRLPNNLPARR